VPMLWACHFFHVLEIECVLYQLWVKALISERDVYSEIVVFSLGMVKDHMMVEDHMSHAWLSEVQQLIERCECLVEIQLENSGRVRSRMFQHDSRKPCMMVCRYDLRDHLSVLLVLWTLRLC
jgi:hypothetical protein